MNEMTLSRTRPVLPSLLGKLRLRGPQRPI